MQSASKRFTLSLNGEIYNYLDIKSELVQKGHRFRGTSEQKFCSLDLSNGASKPPRRASWACSQWRFGIRRNIAFS